MGVVGDARQGTYRGVRPTAFGHRGAAVYKESVYLTTPDAHLVALDARDGKVKWIVQIADARRANKVRCRFDTVLVVLHIQPDAVEAQDADELKELRRRECKRVP